MAKIKLTGHASGTGVITVTAPNTSTDRTITLPDSTDTLAVNSDVTNKLPLAGGTMTGILAGLEAGKTAGNYGAMAEFNAEGSGVKLRIDDNSNASATTRMYIMHNYNRDSGTETCDSSSTGQAAIKFDNGSITLATAAAGNTTAPTNRMTIDNAGAVTMPAQPAFLINSTVTQSNITAGVITTVTFGNEIFDQNADVNTTTFTAPVTGKYLLTTTVRVDSLDSAASYYRSTIATSNRVHNGILIAPKFTEDLAYISLSTTCLADMDAGDTAYVYITQIGGSQQSDIIGDAAYTWFSGHLAC